MTDVANLLAGLADVQEPLAPEQHIPWLLITIMCLLVLLPAIVVFRAHRYRNRWRREALQELELIRLSDTDQLPQLASLLRRVTLYHTDSTTTHLDGDPWLKTLDRCFRTTWFTQDAGRAFGHQLYRVQSDSQVDSYGEIHDLCDTVHALIKRMPSRGALASSALEASSARVIR